MPELPEVETVRRGLERSVWSGARVVRVEVGRERTVRRTSRQAADRRTHRHHDPRHANRRGKYLLLRSRHRRRRDDPPPHERPGAVADRRRPSLGPPHTHVCRTSTSTARTRRRSCGSSTHAPSGRWSCSTPGERRWRDPRPREARGRPDRRRPLSRVLRWLHIVGSRAPALKPLLLDQHVIAGIGNIYCRRDPARRAAPARSHERTTLGTGRRAPASTVRDPSRPRRRRSRPVVPRSADAQYVDVVRRRRVSTSSHIKVYGRAGQRCLTCGRSDVGSAAPWSAQQLDPLLSPLPALILQSGPGAPRSVHRAWSAGLAAAQEPGFRVPAACRERRSGRHG
jgi:formamidopyrimidine-DNA glycosylase